MTLGSSKHLAEPLPLSGPRFEHRERTREENARGLEESAGPSSASSPDQPCRARRAIPSLPLCLSFPISKTGATHTHKPIHHTHAHTPGLIMAHAGTRMHMAPAPPCDMLQRRLLKGLAERGLQCPGSPDRAQAGISAGACTGCPLQRPACQDVPKAGQGTIGREILLLYATFPSARKISAHTNAHMDTRIKTDVHTQV